MTVTSKDRVFVTEMYSGDNPVLSAGRDLINRHRLSNFRIVNSSSEANIVLYLEGGYLGLSDLPRVLARVRAAPDAMHFLFSESDWPFPMLPGAYPSLSRAHPWAHGWAFLPRANAEGSGAAKSNTDTEQKFLFSFLGRVATHPIRKRVEMLNKASTPCLDIEDGPKYFRSFDYSKTYVDLMKQSKFVLCPRGFGVSSIRIFEAMSLGRVPVIISGQWQPPPGIRWSECCVVIREDEIARIPAILNELHGNAGSMGRRAREFYEENFAPNVFIDRLLKKLLSNYGDLRFSVDAIMQRALRALGWRELRTLCHQAQTSLTALRSDR
jgi:Exostosin family